MKKILILSSFPAGYRVDVFKGLAEQYNITVIFGADHNENRNPDWFVKNNEFHYYLVNTDEGRKVAGQCYNSLDSFDIILGYDWVRPWALKFLFKAMRLHIPYALNCDGAFIHKSFVKTAVKRFFISRATACFAGGDAAKEYFLHYGAKEEQVYIHHFTSLHEENIRDRVVTDAERAELRKKLGLPEKTTVLSIGQFIYRKGFDILLDAWKQAGVDAQLVIIGGGDLRPEYESQIRDKNISNVIIMDFVPFKEIFDYYMASDVFALATREDVWGLIVNEAMACGVPVMVSDKCIAGLELIENGKSGFVVEGNTVDNWADKLELILSDTDMRNQMSQRSLDKIRGNTISAIVKNHIKVIDGILGK